MKSTIPNLIAVAALLSGWTAQAADQMESQTPPSATPPAAIAVEAPMAATPAVAKPVTAEKPQSPLKSSKSGKHAKAKRGRTYAQDLRYCLDLPTNAEIAKCAGE